MHTFVSYTVIIIMHCRAIYLCSLGYNYHSPTKWNDSAVSVCRRWLLFFLYLTGVALICELLFALITMADK